MTTTKSSRKILSVCLAVVLAIGMFAGIPLMVNAAEQLPAPANPHWDGETGRGVWGSVKESGDAGGGESYSWKLYRVDAPSASPTELGELVTDGGVYGHPDDNGLTFSFSFAGDLRDSGYYYFEVCADGDGLNYTSSPYILSDAFHYVKPTQALPTPKDLAWAEYDNVPYYAIWSNLNDYADADTFFVSCYDSMGTDDTSDDVMLGGTVRTKAQIEEQTYSGVNLSRHITAASGEYYFEVYVGSSRPNEFLESEIAGPSPMLTITSGIVDDTVEEDVVISSGGSSSSSDDDDDDDDRREDSISSSGSSSVTGGASGTGGAGTSSGSNVTVRDSDNIKQLIESSTTENGKVRSIGTGEVTIDASAWSEFSGQSFFHDSVVDKRVQVRVTIDDPASMTGDIKVSGYTTGEKVESVTKTFNTYFENPVQVVHFDQQGRWGQEVRIAAKLDPGMNTNNLYFYSYDSDTNTYRLLQNPKYQIDANGYVHFSTEYANSIVISEGPLELK